MPAKDITVEGKLQYHSIVKNEYVTDIEKI